MQQTTSEGARPLFKEAADARLFFLFPYSVRKTLLRRWFNQCSVLQRSAAANHNNARFKQTNYTPILRDARTPEEKREAKQAFYRRKRARYFVKYAIPIPFNTAESAPEDKEKMQARANAILFMRRHGLGSDLNHYDGEQKKNDCP
jgi:hypothetical protein